MLILARHGRTAANASGRMQGRADNPLDEVGRAQAQAVAAAVGTADRVLASPLQRAAETAAALGRSVELDERWAELDFGIYDGQPLDEVPREVWEGLRHDPDFAPEGGESNRQLYERVAQACEELLPILGDQRVLVVSHVSPIKAAVAWALGADPGVGVLRTHLDVASISRVVLRAGQPLLVSFNEVAHLDPPEHRVWGVPAR